mmetsp:Transcript_33147/g.28042  ORF Transcript_33147/g.28042 Transcript_33147/m.28042 type:complete len:365 (+) Transcript_33147:972-2066(+)
MQCVAVCVAVCVAGRVGSILPADGGHAIRRGRQVEGRRHELLDLRRMDSAIARRRRGSRVPPHVADALLVDRQEGGGESGLNKGPGTHVLRLLLHPHHLGLGVFGGELLHQLERERRNLLERHDGNVVHLLILTPFHQLVVHLARAEEDALDLVGVLDDLRLSLVDERLEKVARREVRNVRDHLRVAEEGLGRKDDERLAKVALDLAAEAVEVVGGRGDVDDLPVGTLDLHGLLAALAVGHDGCILIGHDEEALKTRRGVLRTLPFIAVRQQQNEARLAQPLLFAGRDKLIDDHLRRVGEIAELRLPQNEGIGVLEGVAELEAQHAVLGEIRVEYCEGRLGIAEVLERDVFALILLIVQDGVAV